MTKEQKIKQLIKIKKHLNMYTKGESNKVITSMRTALAEHYCKNANLKYEIREMSGGSSLYIPGEIDLQLNQHLTVKIPRLYLRCGYGKYNYAPALILL